MFAGSSPRGTRPASGAFWSSRVHATSLRKRTRKRPSSSDKSERMTMTIISSKAAVKATDFLVEFSLSMRAIVIGAGRGSRLQHEPNKIPNTLVEVVGRPMLDWVLEALAAGGFARERVVFVCGYAEHAVRRTHPELQFVRNDDWQNNNILLSLMYAREHMENGFVSTNGDICY